MFFNAVILPLLVVVVMPRVLEKRNMTLTSCTVFGVVILILFHEYTFMNENWLFSTTVKCIAVLILGLVSFKYFNNDGTFKKKHLRGKLW
ncbi:hypothetical protein VT06_16485 [Arsukibacterium sp. MJ3]|nr:hypothetical protein VT06_16485 [Arsukibacterium sp. MJ3]